MGAVPVHHTETDDGTWDGPGQEAKLKTPLTKTVGNDSFAWLDPDGDETTKAAWRFIHHFVAADGTPGSASTLACSTAIGVLNGARTGTTIPDADKKGVWEHLAAHLKDAGVKEEDVPELKADGTPLERRADAEVCNRCDGKKTVSLNGKTVECPQCGGSGTAANNADDDARAHATEVERRRHRAEQLRGRERRTIASGPVEVRTADDGMLHLTGYASVFDRPYDVGWYQETIKRGAFTKTLSEGAQVQLLLNHEGLPLASTRNGTLALSEDGVGLKVDATLDPEDPDSQSVVRKVRSGLMDEMSFAFQAIKQDWDPDYTSRSLTEVSIDKGDVSVVNFGANPATSVAARGALEDFERQAVHFALSVIEHEERAGAAISTANLAKIKTALQLVADADTSVDKAQVVLADLAGVTNPDIAQDKKLNYNDPSANDDTDTSGGANADGETDAPASGSTNRSLPDVPDYTLDAKARLAALRSPERKSA